MPSDIKIIWNNTKKQINIIGYHESKKQIKINIINSFFKSRKFLIPSNLNGIQLQFVLHIIKLAKRMKRMLQHNIGKKRSFYKEYRLTFYFIN